VKGFLICICILGFVVSGPALMASDDEIVDCCIKPCSCLGSKAGKSECKKIRRSECKRLGGEAVMDCALCD
jgi:hypothetical protein